MKKILGFAGMLAFFSIVILACQKNDMLLSLNTDSDEVFITVNDKKMKVILSSDTKNNFVVLENEALFGLLLLPVGTKIEKIEGDPYAFNYTLPEGYITIGKNARTGQSTFLSAGKITCSCTKGTGCSPYVATVLNQTYTGCNMSRTCTSCDQKNARVGVEEPKMLESEIVNMKQEISFVTEETDLSKISAANSTFIDIEPIQKKLIEFVSGFQLNNKEELLKAKTIEDLPKNYDMVTVNLFGKAVMVPIERELSPFLGNSVTNAGFVSRARAATVTCKCETGKEGCKKGTRSMLIGTVVYCDAGVCSKCTLNQ